MNFCFQSTNIQIDCIVQDTLKCSDGKYVQPQTNEFQQNCTKLTIPTSIIRSSSLSKIKNSLKNIDTSISEKQDQNQQTRNMKQVASQKNSSNQASTKNFFSVHKTKVEPSTKSVIVSKLLQKNQSQNKQTQAIKNKQNHNQKQQTDLPANQFYHKHQNVQKMIKLFKEKSQKELKQCTFNPKINAQSSYRNHDTKQFYVGQIQHCRRTQDKVQQLRLMIQAQKQKQNTFRPKLSEETRQLTQRRKNENVYNRLYQQNKEQKCQESQNFTVRSQHKFSRQLSKKSISLVSSSKKRNYNCESQEKDHRKDVQKNYFAQDQNHSQELRKEKSIKTFAQMLETHDKNSLELMQKKKSNNPLSSKRKSMNSSQRQMTQNSQKKGKFQSFSNQLLDCRDLIKQKQQSSSTLSREQSCKLIPSFSKDFKAKNPNNKQADRQFQNKDKNGFRAKTTDRTEKIVLQKFTKEFFTVVHKTCLSKDINFNQMLNLMKNMNFIENLEDFYESNIESEVKTKIFEIWTILEGQQSEVILLINLLKILCSIQGFTNSHMIEQTVKPFLETFNPKETSHPTSGKTLVLSEKDSKAIKKDFMNFYLTRFKLGQSKLYVRQLNGHIYSFRPSISKESQEFAEKYRERMIAESQKLISEGAIDFGIPGNGIIDHSSLLILDEKVKSYKIQQMRVEVQRERRKQQAESMARHSSSHRSINETSLTNRNKNSSKDQELNSNMFSRISHNQSCSRSKDQIFVELYEQGRKSKSNRRDKSADQIEYQEVKEELTFKPKINQIRSVKQFTPEINLHDNIPNFTKEVMRMRKKNLQDDLSTSPLLYLNVTMQGNFQTKIPVYQTDNLHSITQKVRIIMKIQNGEEQKQKLKSILKEQIIPVLDQLGMNGREQQFLSEA